MRFNPEKLHVEYRKGVTPTEPIIGRKYTLTHSDVTVDLFLTVGLVYAEDKINLLKRDEVLGDWFIINNHYTLYLFCHVGDNPVKEKVMMRYAIFTKELGLAIESIRYGDRALIKAHPYLDQAQIWVNFYSVYPEYNRMVYWGKLEDYKLSIELI